MSAARRYLLIPGLVVVAFRLCAAPAPPADPAPLTAGQAALEDGLYALAQQQFESYLARDPTDTPPGQTRKAALLLLEALFRQEKYDDVLHHAQTRLADPPAETADGAWRYWIARARYGLGEHTNCLAETSRLLDERPDSPYAARALRLRGRSFLALDQPEDAIRMFDAFAAAHPESPRAADNLLELGRTLLSVGNTNRAARVLTTLVDQSGASRAALEGHFWLAQELMLERRWQKAAELLQRLVAREDVPGDLRGRAALALADANEQRGNINDAIAAFREGIAMVRSDELARRAGLNLGRLLLAEGQLDAGMDVLKPLIAEAPDDPEAQSMQLTLAEALLEGNRPEAAVGEFQHYVESFTNRTGLAQAYRGKGWGLLALDHNPEAATAFRKAFELFTGESDRARCLFKAGDAYFANGDYDKARELYARFLNTFTTSSLVPNVMFQAAESWARAGNAEQAAAFFQRLVDRYPEQRLAEEALLRIAQLQAREQRLVAAIEGFETLMSRYTNSTFYAEALHGRGMAQYRLFHFRDALRDFERVRNAFPESPLAEQALYRQALCHYGLGEDQEALALCRQFLAAYPESPWIPHVLFWLGQYHFNHAQYEEAEAHLLDFAESYPAHAWADDALLWTGIASSRRNEYVRAVEILTRLVKDYPQSEILPDARFAQANALSHLAKCSAAILIFEEMISNYPDHELVPAAWGRKGDNQFTLGAEDPRRYRESIDSYRMIVNHPNAERDLVMQAAYKIGRSLEKLGQTDEAFEQYYLNVIVRYLEDRKEGIWHNENAKFWFRRAAFDAADIMAARNDWRRVVTILKRVVQSGVPGREVAQERIDKIRADKWWLFY